MNLNTDKAFHLLGWQPVWNFKNTVKNTVDWYRVAGDDHKEIQQITEQQIKDYLEASIIL